MTASHTMIACAGVPLTSTHPFLHCQLWLREGQYDRRFYSVKRANRSLRSESLALCREEDEGGYRQGRAPRRKAPGGRSLLRQHTVSGTWQDTNCEPTKE